MMDVDLTVNPVLTARIAALCRALPQGLLLTGDEGVGLTTLARMLARSYAKTVLDVVPEKGSITIDQIRELYTAARTNTGPCVILIDDADAMGREASNALLKLLEEPGGNIRFILTSHAPDALLPTVMSRVQALAVPRVTLQQTDELMDSLAVSDPTKRAQLLFVAAGLPAAMTRYARDGAAFTARSKTIRDARSFLSGNREDRLVLTGSYGSDRPAAIALVRDMMKLVSLGARAQPDDGTVRTLDTLLGIERDLRENSSVRLGLSYAALTL